MRSAAQGEKSALVKELCGEGYALKYLLAAMALLKSTYCYELAKKTKFKREILWCPLRSLQSLTKTKADAG